MATSKFEPVDARKAFPCFDEPNLKATFTTTLIHKPDFTALSNMPEQVNLELMYSLLLDRELFLVVLKNFRISHTHLYMVMRYVCIQIVPVFSLTSARCFPISL